MTPALGAAIEAIGAGPVHDPEFVDRLEAMAPAARGTGAFHDRHLRYSSYGRCADCRFLADCHPCPLATTGDPGWSDIRRVPDFLCAFNQAALAARDTFVAAS